MNNFIYTAEFVSSVLKARAILSETLIKELNDYYEELEHNKVLQESLCLSASLIEGIPGTKDQKNGNIGDRTFGIITSEDYKFYQKRQELIIEKIKKARKKYACQERVTDIYGSLGAQFPIHWNVVHDILVSKIIKYREAASKYFINKDTIKNYIDDFMELITELANSQYRPDDSCNVADYTSKDLFDRICLRER